MPGDIKARPFLQWIYEKAFHQPKLGGDLFYASKQHIEPFGSAT